MPAACRALPIGSKNCTPCCLTSDLKNAIAEHFAFALVDAGGQVLVHVVAEHVAVQERAAAVRLHEQLDGGFLLRFAAEDLGDDAFHLAAIAFVDQAAAPLHQRVAGRRSGRPAGPGGAAPARAWRSPRRRFCGTWPRESCWPSSAASCRPRWHTATRGPGSGRDRRSSDRRRAAACSRFSAGTRKFLKMMPWLYVCLSAYRPYLRSWNCSFSCVRQIDDQHRRPLVDQAHQADRAAGHDVGDEQLLAVDDVLVAVPLGAWFAGPSGPSRHTARSARRPTAARRWPARAGIAAFVRRCRTCAPDRPRRCSRAPRPGRPRSDRPSPSASERRRSWRTAHPSRRTACRPAGPSSRLRPARRARAAAPSSSRPCCVPACTCLRTTASESCITRSTSGGVCGGVLSNSSTGSSRSQMARCTGLLTV